MDFYVVMTNKRVLICLTTAFLLATTWMAVKVANTRQRHKSKIQFVDEYAVDTQNRLEFLSRILTRKSLGSNSTTSQTTLTREETPQPQTSIGELEFSTKKFVEDIPEPISFPKCGFGRLLRPAVPPSNNSGTSGNIMTVFVRSGQLNLDRRRAARETWASLKSFRGTRFNVIFLLGKSNDNRDQEQLELESNTHKDLLQCDTTGSNNTGSVSILSAFAWLIDNPMPGNLYTFTNDDVILNFMNMHKLFSDVISKNAFYCQFPVDGEATPENTTKRFGNDGVNVDSNSPTIFNGKTWAMTPSLMRDIYHVASTTNQEALGDEDYIIEILREKLERKSLNIKPIRGETVAHDLENRREDFESIVKDKWEDWLQLMPENETVLVKNGVS